MPNNSGYLERDGFHLRYAIEGQGIPALVVGSSVYYPRIFSRNLKQYLKLIHIDNRGFSRGPAGLTDNSLYQIDVLLSDIDYLRQWLKLERFFIVGHSRHAFLALQYAKKFPDVVLGVVMLGVSPDFSDHTYALTEAFFQETASPERKQILEKNMCQLDLRIRAHPDKRFMYYCLAAGPKSWFDPTFDASPLWEGVYTNNSILDYVWGVLFRDIDLRSGLDNLSKPVFLGLGKYDFVAGPPGLWDQMRPYFRDITVRVFPKSAHTPPYEEPATFDYELLTWIGTKASQYKFILPSVAFPIPRD